MGLKYIDGSDAQISTTPNKEQVNHPSHYAWLKELCGVEPLDICRHLDFNCGSILKYILRKGKEEKNLDERQQRIQDLKKAKVYLEDEIRMLENQKIEDIEND